MLLELALPWPPSMNTYWRSVVMGKSPRVLISKRGREYRQEVMDSIDMTPLNGRLGVWIQAHVPDRRKRDLDNLLKPVLDALQHAGVYLDDEQIDDLHITRQNSPPKGRLIITIEELEDGELEPPRGHDARAGRRNSGRITSGRKDSGSGDLFAQENDPKEKADSQEEACCAPAFCGCPKCIPF